MLKLENIVKHYQVADTKVQALKGISVQFRKNEFVSILGPSGCGKTTLLNIIGGLDKMTSGDLVISGKSTKNYVGSDWDTYRNHSVGFVFQTYNLIPHQSVLGNVELALTLSGVSKAVRRQKAIQALEKVGLHDQINKRPNQLSGGQMQRVAIARAIVNDPEILLADEPTGALDTETSIQILDIIKEIAKDRLVIMVTHNPELAVRYSTRIIKLLDGNMIDDSMPYATYDEDIKNTPVREKLGKKKKSSMSFGTALSLSFRNLFSKKFRTIITAFAGSIGIIGIALVLSISNGFTNYINKMQSDTLSGYPLTIDESFVDLTSMISHSEVGESLEEYPEIQKIFVQKMLGNMMSMQKTNKINAEYINYVKQIKKDLYYEIGFNTGYSLINNLVVTQKLGLVTTSMTIADLIESSSINGGDSFAGATQMIENTDLIKSQYDIIYGQLPTNKNEVILVVDEKNQILDYVFGFLGIASFSDVMNPDNELDFYTFEDIMQQEFKILSNNDLYTKVEASGSDPVHFAKKTSLDLTKAATLNISGILRPKKDTTMGCLTAGMCFSKDTVDFVLNGDSTFVGCKDSEIVQFANSDKTIDPFTGKTYTSATSVEDGYKHVVRPLGGDDSVVNISIYAKDFDAKKEIKTYLDAYNVGKDEDSKVQYSDNMELFLSALTTIVDAISYVLIAFVAISLVVSSIMIAIITYVSVIERTKEIGVLRSIGARKMDISRVFNAETFIIGLSAGVFGVLIAVLLDLPINLIIGNFVDGIGNIASLNPIHGLVLIGISIVLTLLSGLIPARIAANKDPVNALRSE